MTDEHLDDAQPIRFQFVFQGGGARLATLIAAAQAVYNLTNDEKAIRLTRVTGTSAGAIAACMLSSGKSPSEFRTYLRANGSKILKDVMTFEAPTTWAGYAKAAYKVYRGEPLYNSKKYRDFLGTMFMQVSQKEKMQNLNSIFYATDLKNGTVQRYDGAREQDVIKDALFASSALPFVFATFKTSSVCDGGIINNFPSGDIDISHGDALGFSFAKSGQYNTSNAFNYALATMFTAMDVSVAKSLALLPPDNVFSIETDIGTLDFRKALDLIDNDAQYDKYVRECEGFILSAKAKREVEKLGNRIVPNNAIEELARREKDQLNALVISIKQYHDHLIGESDYSLIRRTLICTCDGLGGNVTPKCDLISVREVMVPSRSLSAYLAIINTDDLLVNLDRMRPQIREIIDGDSIPDDTYRVIPIQMPDSYVGENKSEGQRAMFFIHPPLKAASRYEIRYSIRADKILSDVLKETGTDYFASKCKVDVGLMRILFYVPESLDIVLSDVGTHGREVLTGMVPDKLTWSQGELVQSGALAQFDPKPDMKLIGWQASDLKAGTAVGVEAALRIVGGR